MMKTVWYGIVICMTCFVMGACGYRFAAGGLLPGKTKTAAVMVFENQSFYSGAENIFTNALIQEIMRQSDTRVVGVDQAEAVITGIVRSVTFSRLSRAAGNQLLEQRVVAVVDLVMTDKKGNTVWELKNYTGIEDAAVSSENISDEAAKRESIHSTALKMAHKMVGKMLNEF